MLWPFGLLLVLDYEADEVLSIVDDLVEDERCLQRSVTAFLYPDHGCFTIH